MAGFVIPNHRVSHWTTPNSEKQLTLNVVAQNLTVTLGSTLSKSLERRCQQRQRWKDNLELTFPPFPRPDMFQSVVEGGEVKVCSVGGGGGDESEVGKQSPNPSPI